MIPRLGRSPEKEVITHSGKSHGQRTEGPELATIRGVERVKHDLMTKSPPPSPKLLKYKSSKIIKK